MPLFNKQKSLCLKFSNLSQAKKIVVLWPCICQLTVLIFFLVIITSKRVDVILVKINYLNPKRLTFLKQLRISVVPMFLTLKFEATNSCLCSRSKVLTLSSWYLLTIFAHVAPSLELCNNLFYYGSLSTVSITAFASNTSSDLGHTNFLHFYTTATDFLSHPVISLLVKLEFITEGIFFIL